MKKITTAILAAALIVTSSPFYARQNEDIQTLGDQTDALYRTGAGAQDGAYTSLGTSMIGWGLGLAVGIAILAGVLHQSKVSHEAHCH